MMHHFCTISNKIWPWRVLGGFLGSTLERLWPQTPKKPKKITFWDILFDDLFVIFSYFSGDCFLCVFYTSLEPGFGWKKHKQASISKASGCYVWDNLNKSWIVETTIPCESGHENQGFEACVFFVFVNFVSMFSRRNFSKLILRCLVIFHIFL